jgi:hypothetical protein
MFNWVVGGLGSMFGFVGEAAGQVAGWAWEKVTVGIYTWLANGLALLIEWVWGVLDSGTTPQVTAPWFSTELGRPIAALALAVTIAMMLASATQAALAGRPEQIGDAVKEGMRAIVATALTVTVIDVLIGIVDEASAMVWASGRADLVTMLEQVAQVAAAGGPLATTFVGPLCLLVGFIGLIGLVVALMMRSALIYVAAALAPLVWSSAVLPMFRGSSRKLIHLLVALIVSKLAIVITLVVAVKLTGNVGGDPDSSAAVNDGAAAVGTLMSGFVCFLIASVTPFVLYKLMPTVEGAMVGAGVAGGWGRSLTTGAHTAMMVKSFGASGAASAATRGVAGQTGVAGSGPGGAGGFGGMAGTPAATGRTQPSGGAGAVPAAGAGNAAPTAVTPSAGGSGDGRSSGGSAGGRHGPGHPPPAPEGGPERSHAERQDT